MFVVVVYVVGVFMFVVVYVAGDKQSCTYELYCNLNWSEFALLLGHLCNKDVYNLRGLTKLRKNKHNTTD